MQWRVVALMAASLAFGTGMAQAQSTVLEYQGNIMIGTNTSLPTGQSSLPLPSAPFGGYFTALINLEGPIGPTSLMLQSWQVNLDGTNGINLTFGGGNEAPILLNCCLNGSGFVGPDEIGITTLDGAITGATMGIGLNFYHSPTAEITIGPAGDSIFYQYGTTQGACENMVPAYSGGSPYEGPPINPCLVDASTDKPGRWTVSAAPEIDPRFGITALTLLLGGLAVLRGSHRA